MFGCTTTKNSNTENKEPSIMDIYGSVDGGEYINEYYGFTLNFPEDYIVQDDEAKNHALEVGNDFLNGDDQNSKEQMKLLAEQQLFNLLFITKYEIGTPDVENLVIQIAGENVKYLPGIKNGKDYLWFLERQIEAGGIKLLNKSEFLLETINGIEFYTFSYEMEIQNIIVKQKFFTKKVGNHMLSFSATFFTDEGYDEVMQSINTITLLENSKMIN
jgi:hypothetical protein